MVLNNNNNTKMNMQSLLHTVGTCALVRSDMIQANTPVLTRITGTFVYIDLALFARPTCMLQRKHVSFKSFNCRSLVV